MHKYLLVSLAIVALSGGVFGDSSEEILDSLQSTRLKTYMSQHKEHVDSVFDKLEEKCSGVTSKLKTALVNFQECVNRTDDSLTICTALQTATLNCTAPLLEIVDDCLPPKARGLPRLGLKSVLSISDYLCKQTGEIIFELSNPCVWNEESENTFANEDCEKKIEDFADKVRKEEIPSQAEICTFVTGLRGCVQESVNHDCKNSKTRSAILGFFDAAVAPCSHINEV